MRNTQHISSIFHVELSSLQIASIPIPALFPSLLTRERFAEVKVFFIPFLLLSCTYYTLSHTIIQTVPRTELTGDPDRYVKAGSTVIFRCVVIGALEQPSYIMWYHGTQQIYAENRRGWNVQFDRDQEGDSHSSVSIWLRDFSIASFLSSFSFVPFCQQFIFFIWRRQKHWKLKNEREQRTGWSSDGVELLSELWGI